MIAEAVTSAQGGIRRRRRNAGIEILSATWAAVAGDAERGDEGSGGGVVCGLLSASALRKVGRGGGPDGVGGAAPEDFGREGSSACGFAASAPRRGGTCSGREGSDRGVDWEDCGARLRMLGGSEGSQGAVRRMASTPSGMDRV